MPGIDPNKDGDAKDGNAAGWVMRLRDPAFDDWDAFTSWLEADEANSAAYEEATLAAEEADQAIGRAAPIVVPTFPAQPARPKRLWRAPAVAAAVLVLGVTGYRLVQPAASFTTIATAAGEHRSLRLRDGTRMDLNGGTRISIADDRTRLVRLEYGEAMFDVVHDPANPLTVQLGKVKLQDVGTRFNVIQAGAVTNVAVAEGSVIYDPDGQPVKLGAGQRLAASMDRNMVGKVDPASVGTWRRHELVYDNDSVSQVAEDIARNISVPVHVDPAIASRRFSGVISLNGSTKALFARAALMLDATAEQRKDGWYLRAPTRAAR